MASVGNVHTWFDEAALSSLGYPEDCICLALARELQIAVNRADNAGLERLAGRELPILDLKDVSPAEIISKRWWMVRAAANHLAFALGRYEEFVPRHEWPADAGFNEMDAALGLMSAYPQELVFFPATKGRRQEVWHAVGHVMAPLIQDALRSIGCKSRVAKTDHLSSTAIIGAAAISWAYGIELQPEGFASAMRRRNRRSK